MSLPKTWRAVVGAELRKPYFAALEAFVDGERAKHPGRIYPPEEDVFAAFHLAPFDGVDVLLLGQDPYFRAGQAHGLCFSVRPHVTPPPSLKNIFKELHADVNSVLTVRDGAPLSHRGHGWETFTDAVISRVSGKPTPVVFVLWGEAAQKKLALIDTARHTVIKGAHPSPQSATHGFFGSRPFSAINRALAAAGQPAIDWRIPDLAP
jgi:uracil-DNA glycosylase